MKQFKKISKKVFITALCSMSLLFIAPGYIMQAHAAVPTDTETISPQADVLRWVYEEREDGLWKRLYNTTRGVWVGEWIYVGPANS